MPYADSAFAPQADVHYASTEATVTLSTQARVGDVVYTTDGSEPNAQSKRYQAPLNLLLPTELRVATVFNGQPLSRTRTIPLRHELAQRRVSQELKLCSEGIPISIEDDGPVKGPRAIFMADIQSPCWIFPQAELDQVAEVTAAVGQIPFNFQVGDLVNQITFAKPGTPAGELEVHLDDCKGDVIARLPLASAIGSNAVTTLPPMAIASATGKIAGRHDLCLKFAQKFSYADGDPLWMLDWIQLIDRAPAPKTGAP